MNSDSQIFCIITVPGALDVLRAVEVFLDGGEGEEVLRVGLARDLDLPQHVPLRRPPQHRAQQTLKGTLHDIKAQIYFDKVKIGHIYTTVGKLGLRLRAINPFIILAQGREGGGRSKAVVVPKLSI